MKKKRARKAMPSELSADQVKAIEDESGESKNAHDKRVIKEDKALKKLHKTVSERWLEMSTPEKIVERWRTPMGWKTTFFAMTKQMGKEDPDLVKRLRKEKRVACERTKVKGKETFRIL